MLQYRILSEHHNLDINNQSPILLSLQNSTFIQAEGGLS